MNQLINHEAVFRTAPATPSLSIISQLVKSMINADTTFTTSLEKRLTSKDRYNQKRRSLHLRVRSNPNERLPQKAWYLLNHVLVFRGEASYRCLPWHGLDVPCCQGFPVLFHTINDDDDDNDVDDDDYDYDGNVIRCTPWLPVNDSRTSILGSDSRTCLGSHINIKPTQSNLRRWQYCSIQIPLFVDGN